MARLTPERRTEAALIIKQLLEPGGCLQIVLASRLATHGFSPKETMELLDNILKDHGYFPVPYDHPVLCGHVSYMSMADAEEAIDSGRDAT